MAKFHQLDTEKACGATTDPPDTKGVMVEMTCPLM
jgi:hypothetical protein